MRSKQPVLWAFLISALVGPALAAGPSRRDGTTDRSSAAETWSIDIDNFGRLNEHYYRGEQPDPRDYADLARLGIRTVIDLQADGDNSDEARLVEQAGMRFIRIPMTTRVPPTTAQLEQFLEIVTDPAQQPVFVHCKGGRHRTGVMSAVYRVEYDGWTAQQAFEEMQRYKFGPAFLHPEFKQFLFRYRPRTASGVR